MCAYVRCGSPVREVSRPLGVSLTSCDCGELTTFEIELAGDSNISLSDWLANCPKGVRATPEVFICSFFYIRLLPRFRQEHTHATALDCLYGGGGAKTEPGASPNCLASITTTTIIIIITD